MVDLQQVVALILYLLAVGIVFGLLYFLVDYIGRKFPGETTQIFVKIAHIVLVVLAVLIAIGIVISLAGVGPGQGAGMFRWGPPAR